MTRYYTDFGTDTVGQVPAGWTEQWSSAGQFSVQSRTGADGGQLLEGYSTVGGRHAISWDTIESSADVEIYTKGSALTAFNGPSYLRSQIHCTGTAGSESGYYIDVSHAGQVFRLRKYTSTHTTVDLASIAFSWTTDDVIETRFRCEGNQVKAKIWKGTETEPDAWTLTATDTEFNSGWQGLGFFSDSSDSEWDVVGVGTNGDVAPTSYQQIYETTFGTDVVGQVPEGWTAIWDNPEGWYVRSNANADSGQALHTDSLGGHQAARWDEPGIDIKDAEVYNKIEIVGTSRFYMTPLLRGSHLLPEPVGSPIHWWPITEGSGTTLMDERGTDNGTINGLTWVSDSWIGSYALEGTGTGGYVNTGTVDVSGQFAVCWTMVHQFTGGSVGTRQDPISGGWDAVNNIVPWQVIFRADTNELYADSWDGTNVTAPSVSMPVSNLPGPGVKHRVVLQYNGTDWQFWVNGTLAASNAGGYGAVAGNTSRYLFAIDDNGTPNNFFDGQIDDVVIYNRSLTTQEVTDDYARQPWRA